MKRRWKNLIAAAVGMCFILCIPQNAMADDGSQRGYTYNYDYWEDVQYSPDAYTTAGIYTSIELGLDQGFSSAEGMYVSENQVYICDTGNNRIVELEWTDQNTFRLVRVIDEIKGNTEVKSLSGPTDICVTDEKDIYICDKGNHRILKLDSDLNYLMEFTKPTDATFDQSTDFLPDKLEVDDVGRVFCIADNVNKGMIKYESDGSFTGFYGASPVKYDWSDYIWKKLATKEQRSAMESFVPTEYDNLYRDSSFWHKNSFSIIITSSA